jgi:hypothetical protein
MTTICMCDSKNSALVVGLAIVLALGLPSAWAAGPKPGGDQARVDIALAFVERVRANQFGEVASSVEFPFSTQGIEPETGPQHDVCVRRTKAKDVQELKGIFDCLTADPMLMTKNLMVTGVGEVTTKTMERPFRKFRRSIVPLTRDGALIEIDMDDASGINVSLLVIVGANSKVRAVFAHEEFQE